MNPPPDPDLIESKTKLEIQQLRQQVKKLRLEIIECKRSARWDWVGRCVPPITAIIAGFGLWFSVGKFNQERLDAVTREAAKPFWEKQLQVYLQAADAAAEIAVQTDAGKAKDAQILFWKLYWGSMGCVEDVTLATASTKKKQPDQGNNESKPKSEVEAAMVAFGNALLTGSPATAAIEKSGPTPIVIRTIDSKLAEKLQPLALNIAHAMRKQLTPSFNLVPEDPPAEAMRKPTPPPATPAPPSQNNGRH
jgi:hypothetical protein